MTQNTQSAGGIILNVRGEVALVKSGPDFWGFPKGHIDPGEDAITAARREITEETGLTEMEMIKELPLYTRYKGLPDGGDDTSESKEMHLFLFTTTQEKLEPQDDFNPEARWVSTDEVEALLTHPKDKEFFASIKDSLK